MTLKTSPFDSRQGELLKEEGIAQAEMSRKEVLKLGQQTARYIAKLAGEVTADDVGEYMWKNWGIDSLGPAAGALFRGKEWRFTGRWKKSPRVSNHARMNRVWELVD